MSENKNKFYVTTPIYYATAKPHLGSLYSTLIADVAARWNRLLGKQVFFLTGTDEHGQKIVQEAEKAGKTPQELVDSLIDAYKDTWRMYEINYTKFMRTTDESHVKAVQHWLKYLQEKGDIYKGFYTGWYCTPCETFVSEKGESTKQPACPECGRSTQEVSEETYFFKLSAYQDKLLQFYKDHPDFIIPQERFNEVISFVESGLKDLSISRTTVKWGIPFPDDSTHIAYVWADALNNYITAIGYAQKGKEEEFNRWWPADLHVLGKDIVRFHAVYWPAFLMASGLELPDHLLVHGWIQIDEKKMSKSLGNVVDPVVLYEQFGADAVRFYLMRYMAITQDGNFSTADLEKTITADLANDLGNLLNRVLVLAEKNSINFLEPPQVWSESALLLQEQAQAMLKTVSEYMERYYIHMALGVIWKFVNQANAYFHEQEPWKLAKTNSDDFKEVLSATSHALRIIALATWPIMPKKMEELLKSLGSAMPQEGNIIEKLISDEWSKEFKFTTIPALFIKPDGSATQLKSVDTTDQFITIDDVAKVQLVVGTITECEAIEKSDKLLKMQVDFGEKGKRQILAGIKKFYTPGQLVGKQGVFVVNLKPRIMLGHESQGMMLLAPDAEGKFMLISAQEEVPSGTRLR